MLAKLVKNLREKTGAGFLDCKKALESSNLDVEKAVIWLQEKGRAKAVKKFNVIAAEGIVQTALNNEYAIIFELNSQTDFVANNDEFQMLAQKMSTALLENDFNTIDEAKMIKIGDKTINELIIELISKIGEKIELRRVEKIKIGTNVIGAYTHVNKRIAAIFVSNGGNENAIRNVAMHVASMNPQFLNSTSVPSNKIKKFEEEIVNSPKIIDKPKEIKDKIAMGMLKKRLAEFTLEDQEFVMEKIKVSDYLNNNNAKAIKMIRYELGEGMEKNNSDFVSEVKAQIKN